MILKGRCRADGSKLAEYLLSPKNEQVSVLDVRGLVGEERSPQGLKQALGDMDELGKMTRAKSSLFHLAINPDDRDRLSPGDWQESIAKAEKALGLEEQPRAIVSHTYQGKEHLHVVWSRVDVEQRKCVEMSFSHRKLCQAAREIEQELGLEVTPMRKAQQVKQRAKDIEQHQDQRSSVARDELKADVSAAWRYSADGLEFQARLVLSGYHLVQGRRGPIILDKNGEAHSPARLIEGVKVKDVNAKCTDLIEDLPKLQEARNSRKLKLSPSRARRMTRAELEQQLTGSFNRTPDRGPQMGL